MPTSFSSRSKTFLSNLLGNNINDIVLEYANVFSHGELCICEIFSNDCNSITKNVADFNIIQYLIFDYLQGPTSFWKQIFTKLVLIPIDEREPKNWILNFWYVIMFVVNYWICCVVNDRCQYQFIVFTQMFCFSIRHKRHLN